jgi:branched-chain amino acid transport system ATP-binding protein
MKANLAAIRTIVMPKKRRPESIDDTRLLEVDNLSMAFGVLSVLKQVSFSVARGNILVMIGPNGAGKSTLLKLISGLLTPASGEIWFKGQRIDGVPPHRIAALGISQLFQDIQLFRNMSVIENVMVGCHLQAKSDFMSSGLRLARARVDEQGMFEAAMKQLTLVGLREKASSSPGSLSWGQQKLVGLARALATGSELLLLDEPYSGLLADEVAVLNQLILALQSRGMTILIVEHLTDILMGIASRVIVLDYGEKIAEGTPVEIQKNKRVIDAYLGGEQLEDEES